MEPIRLPLRMTGWRRRRPEGRRGLIDTDRRRSYTKSNLMDELRKVTRVIGQELPGAPHEVLLVLDATLGQNALAQARQFHQAIGVTGLALTKLDGTARGGIVVAIADELKLPIRLIGVGEAVDDLQDFQPQAFVNALLGLWSSSSTARQFISFASQVTSRMVGSIEDFDVIIC